ncbi:hypothetical protein NIES4071_26890 [Calothrix sp. NIES-4071]|nr:hypothetical protein NIES4071_26890 [Calothrix sp. NIES-4071]BAZ57011.1 hypothetical protein NIES4105_26830 [Calothrix sp. NIES-4105]
MNQPNINLFNNESLPNNQLKQGRIISLDMLRGLVMVLMVLDHARTFLSGARFRPTDLTQTTIPLFLTRWVTHLCASSFIFLAGAAAYLYFVRRQQSKQQLSRYLIIRGLILVFLELTLVRFAWLFDPTYTVSAAGVLWAIGWSMVILAAIIYLPMRVIAYSGILLIVGHNLFDNLHVEQFGNFGWLWAVVHEPKVLTIFANKKFFVSYPLIPWIGVMAIGYVFGSVFTLEKAVRHKLLRGLGLFLIFAFLLLRAVNIYGDPEPWSVQANLGYTILSFINCTKYPPSLLFLLMTLGSAILLLDLFDNHRFRVLKPLILFGRVPLFFYVIHLWLIRCTAVLLALPKYGFKSFFLPFIVSSQMPADYGYDLPIIYSIWIITVILLYPMCNWLADYKKKHTYWWLNYI